MDHQSQGAPEPEAGKVLQPVSGGGANVAIRLTESGGARKRGRRLTRGTPKGKRIPPLPLEWTELTRDRAEKLATLPRGRLDEFTWAAISGLVASAPGTAHTIATLRESKTTFSLSLPQATDFAVTLVFLVLLSVAIFSKHNRLTSMQYLERHFGPDMHIPESKAAPGRIAQILSRLRRQHPLV